VPAELDAAKPVALVVEQLRRAEVEIGELRKGGIEARSKGSLDPDTS
jgi:hypothetical protein